VRSMAPSRSWFPERRTHLIFSEPWPKVYTDSRVNSSQKDMLTSDPGKFVQGLGLFVSGRDDGVDNEETTSSISPPPH